MPRHEGDELLVGFAHACRAAGIAVTPDRTQGFLTASALLGAGARASVHAAGRATLCAGPEDLVRYDQVFEGYFDAQEGLPRAAPPRPGRPRTASLPLNEAVGSGSDGSEPDDREVVRAMASDAEVLRHRDVASLDSAEKARLAALLRAIRPRAATRRTARLARARRGRLDARRTLRATQRHLGEPAAPRWRARTDRPRRVVLLVDVSGSMSAYAEVLLRLAHRLVHGDPRLRGRVEVFTLGTRLTHLTRALRDRDPERALVAAGAAVPDWSGGTRLGETLQVFATRWGRRGLARGAVLVVFSDGWERGDTSLLADQTASLRRVAHRLIWVNPHRGKVGYEPLQAGIRAVLPSCDDFVAGHSLATYAELMEVIADA